MTVSDHELLNTVAPAFDAQFRYFAGPNYGMMLGNGLGAVLDAWTDPDSPPENWTEVTDRIAYASKLTQTLQGSSLIWNAELSGWQYYDDYFGLGLSILCWRRFWRPTGNDATYGANLLTNGGFETFTGTADDGVADTFADWPVVSGGNSVQASAATKYAGAASLKLTSAGSAAYVERDLTTTTGAEYRLTGRQLAAEGATLRIIRGGLSDTFLTTTGAWEPFEIIWTESGSSRELWLMLSSAGTAYFDDLVFEQIIPATAPLGWQPWQKHFCGEIVSRNDKNGYQNGYPWRRTITGTNFQLSSINAPRITAGKIRVAEGGSVTGNEPLEPVEAERDTGEFVGGRANVDLANITDGNRNTVYISGTIPNGTAVPFPIAGEDGAVLPSEVFVKPFPGWSIDRSWWVEVFNQRSQNQNYPVGFQCATHSGGVYTYYPIGDGSQWGNVSADRCMVFCANRRTFDELTGGDNNGAEKIVDISQFGEAHLSLDAAVYAGQRIIAWAPGGAARDYVFEHAFGTEEWHGATFNSTLLADGESILNTFADTPLDQLSNWEVNEYPHPGANGTGEGPVWFKVTLLENTCLTLDAISAASTTIRLDNYVGWLAAKTGWGPTGKGVISGCVFNWIYRDVDGLHGVTWVNAPGAAIPASTRCYPYVNNEAQTGYPLTATHLVRRKFPAIESYRVYWSQFDALGYADTGWRLDYYPQSHTVQKNAQNLRLTDRLGDGTYDHLWVRSILYLIDRMTDGGRAKVNEVEADLSQLALELTGTAALDGNNSAELARYLYSQWCGLSENDFIDESYAGIHTMGQHALAITPVASVLDDLARATGCLCEYGRDGRVYWREDPWWPLNSAAASVVWPFDGSSYRGEPEINQTPAQIDFVILNAISLEEDAHTLRIVYPTPIGTIEPPVWAMVTEVNDRVVAQDADASLVAQMEFERAVLSNRGAQLVVKGAGEWAKPGQRVGLYFDYTGTAAVQYKTWIIQSVTTVASENGRQRSYETSLLLSAFRG